MTWGLAQAGNRAGRTGRYLQWWEREPEWDAVTSALQNPHDALSFLPIFISQGHKILPSSLAPKGARQNGRMEARTKNKGRAQGKAKG